MRGRPFAGPAPSRFGAGLAGRATAGASWPAGNGGAFMSDLAVFTGDIVGSSRLSRAELEGA
ncbi:MAG: hypothetical protein ACQEUZ_16885, partial [Pseudomonadota bacterium]